MKNENINNNNNNNQIESKIVEMKCHDKVCIYPQIF